MTWSPRRSFQGLIGTGATLALSLSMVPAFANESVGNSVSDPAVVTSEVLPPVVDPARAPITNPVADFVQTDANAPAKVVVTPARLFSKRATWAYEMAREQAPRTSAGYYKTPAYARWYGKQVATHKYKWSNAQFTCLNNLWTKESHWGYRALGLRKKFLGIPQFYKGNLLNMGISVSEFMKTPELQIQIGTAYIKGRYGTPCSAWKHFKKRRWY